MAFPKKARFVVIGAGVHGLSTAWHLAEKLKKKMEMGLTTILWLSIKEELPQELAVSPVA